MLLKLLQSESESIPLLNCYKKQVKSTHIFVISESKIEFQTTLPSSSEHNHFGWQLTRVCAEVNGVMYVDNALF